MISHHEEDVQRYIVNKKLTRIQFEKELKELYAKEPNHLINLMEFLDENEKTSKFVRDAVKASYKDILKNLQDKDPQASARLILIIAAWEDDKSNLCEFLSTTFNLSYPTLLALANMPNNEDILSLLIPLYIEKFNLFMLQEINKLNPKIFETAIANNKTLTEEQLGQIREPTDPQQAYFISKHMHAFTKEFGNIDYDSGRIAAIEIAQRKLSNKDQSYIFDPTFLKGTETKVKGETIKENNEFKEYLSLLKPHKPIRERFVIAEQHWVVGEINIDDDGHASIFIIDSLGRNSDHFPSHIIKAFNEQFPDGTIYFSEEKRQHAELACQMFALDDLVHLYTMEKYFQQQYGLTKIFDYLAAQPKDNKIVKDELPGIDIISAKLPISLLSTKQSNKLFSDLFPSRNTAEQKAPVNKKGQTAEERATAGLEEGKNVRLTQKMKNLANHVFKFLFHQRESLPSLSKSMEDFSLQGFKKRMAEKTNTLEKTKNFHS